ITGSAYIAISGNSGTLFLNSSNSFTGPLSVGSSADPGLLIHLGNDFALGATTAGTTNAGPKSGLFLDVAFNNTSEPLTIGGNGPFGTDGAIQISGGANWNTNIFLTTNTLVNSGSGSLVINGVVSGAGGFTKKGTGTLTLSGTTGGNSYAGNTVVNEGILQLN